MRSRMSRPSPRRRQHHRPALGAARDPGGLQAVPPKTPGRLHSTHGREGPCTCSPPPGKVAPDPSPCVPTPPGLSSHRPVPRPPRLGCGPLSRAQLSRTRTCPASAPPRNVPQSGEPQGEASFLTRGRAQGRGGGVGVRVRVGVAWAPAPPRPQPRSLQPVWIPRPRDSSLTHNDDTTVGGLGAP